MSSIFEMVVDPMFEMVGSSLRVAMGRIENFLCIGRVWSSIYKTDQKIINNNSAPL